MRTDPGSGPLTGTERLYPTFNFNTGDGKFKWYATRAWDGFQEAEAVHKYLNGAKAGQYPFWFTMGRSQTIWQTAYHQRHLAEKTLTVPLPFLEINAEDGKRLGVSNGDMVTVSNEEGTAKFVVTIADPTGTVFALMYQWLGTSNSLTSPYTDPMSTNPWYKGTRVAISKAAGALPSVVRTTSLLPTNTFT